MITQRAQATLLNGRLNYQVQSQDPASVQAGSPVAIGADVRLWTGSEEARIQLDDGSVIALGPFTTFDVEYLTGSASADSPAAIHLDGGSLYVISESLSVLAKDKQYKAMVNGTQMGIKFDAAEDVYDISCFGQQGTCQVQGPTGFAELNAGERISYHRDILGPLSAADYNAWQDLCKPDCADPLMTSTPIATSKPAAKPSPSITATHSATITPTITLTPVPPTFTKTPGAQQTKEDSGREKGGGSGGGGGTCTDCGG